MRSKIRYAPLLLALFAFGCAHAPRSPNVVKEGDAPYFGTAKVHRYRLQNGLKVLILEDHSAPTFAYHTWFHVGSKDEQPGLTGLAHLFEHMMFKETKNLKDGVFDRLLESAGAEGENAFTSRDYTGYIQSLPSDKLDLIARLESERMVNLIVNDEALSKEREVVQNERRFREENNPDGQLYERIYELAFRKHSYHWPVIGYDQDLKNASRKDCEAFYRRFYAPNNATVVIVGDVNPDKAIATIEKHYKDIAASKIDRPVSLPEPAQTAEQTEVKQIKTPVQKLMMGYRIPSVAHDDFAALEVLRNILTSGRSSRLHRALVDGGIATGVETENEEKAEPGLFIVFVNMQKGKTAQQALPVIDRELGKIASGKVSEEELQRAISMHRFSIFDGLASAHAKAQFLGFYETVAGRFERGVELAESLRKIDRATLARVARQYFKKENRTVIIGMQKKG